MSVDNFPKIYLYRRIALAKLFIDSRFDEAIDLNDIAGEALFSKFHFIRLFKMAYGLTPHQYLTYVRIEQAKLHLQTEMTVQEVCFRVGFDSESSFTHLFKRVTTVAPSVYQRQQQLRKLQITNTPLSFIPSCFAAQKGWIKNRNSQQDE